MSSSVFFCVALTVGRLAADDSAPLSLHPENPRYFLFRGKPAVLITSGEHYGAVLNLDFDFVPYLDELRARGFNLTRTFSGAYREIPGSFNIRQNTLAPLPGRYACPWARSTEPGYSQGGNKFDLTKWDAAYLERLKTFLAAARDRGVIVELVLFCPMYDEDLWKACPMNAANNVNGVGAEPSKEVYTLAHQDLVDVQAALARKLVEETAEFANLYYEICNEPYFGGVTLEWQRRIAETIEETERKLGRLAPGERHLIAQNIANKTATVADPDPRVSIFNFHYASPPDAVGANWGLKRPIAFDETGFRGPGDAAYRTEAWEFLLAGGAVYSNLDYSFTPADGKGSALSEAPGGGGPTLRGQLATLKKFMEGHDFISMAPAQDVLRGGAPAGFVVRALASPGKEYVVYARRVQEGKASKDAKPRDLTLRLDLPAGKYAAKWLNPVSGKIELAQDVDSPGGEVVLGAPRFEEDIALSLRKN